MKRLMTDKEYVQAGGCRCPACRSDSVEGRKFDGEATEAWLDMTCLNCGATWNEIYKLTGYDNLTQGDRRG